MPSLSLLKPDLFTVQISRTKMGYMDVREINSEASLGLFMDMLAGEKSIARRVFGILFSFSSLFMLGSQSLAFVL